MLGPMAILFKFFLPAMLFLPWPRHLIFPQTGQFPVSNFQFLHILTNTWYFLWLWIFLFCFVSFSACLLAVVLVIWMDVTRYLPVVWIYMSLLMYHEKHLSTCLLTICTLCLKKRLLKWSCVHRFINSERTESTFWVVKSSPRSWAPQSPSLVVFVMPRLGDRHCYQSCFMVGETKALEI